MAFHFLACLLGTGGIATQFKFRHLLGRVVEGVFLEAVSCVCSFGLGQEGVYLETERRMSHWRMGVDGLQSDRNRLAAGNKSHQTAGRSPNHSPLRF